MEIAINGTLWDFKGSIFDAENAIPTFLVPNVREIPEFTGFSKIYVSAWASVALEQNLHVLKAAIQPQEGTAVSFCLLDFNESIVLKSKNFFNWTRKGDFKEDFTP